MTWATHAPPPAGTKGAIHVTATSPGATSCDVTGVARRQSPPGDTVDTLDFIGTATTLIRLGSFTVLTDPNFLHRGQRAYLGKGLWSRRLTDPAIEPEDVPTLDAV